ncbi:hypothetical protein [Roseovarius sp. 2305UL8-3]|uniref:hypothetical protein n=1 Tax=Roseovarius conchicola TaxID=3121636 RepID=UPI003529A591
MDIVEVLKEVRVLAETFSFTKWELYAVLLLVLVTLRLRTILTHVREMAVIRAESARKSKLLDAKIQRQKKKRSKRVEKGDNK